MRIYHPLAQDVGGDIYRWNPVENQWEFWCYDSWARSSKYHLNNVPNMDPWTDHRIVSFEETWCEPTREVMRDA